MQHKGVASIYGLTSFLRGLFLSAVVSVEPQEISCDRTVNRNALAIQILVTSATYETQQTLKIIKIDSPFP
jgi:hypothetical protein